MGRRRCELAPRRHKGASLGSIAERRLPYRQFGSRQPLRRVSKADPPHFIRPAQFRDGGAAALEEKSCSSETLRRLSVAPSVSFLFGSTHPPNPPYLFAPNRNACPDWLAESVLSAPQSLAVLHVIGSNSSQPFHMLRILGYPRGCDKQAPTINKLRFNAHVAALCHFTGTYPATRLVIIAYFARVAERAMSASNNAGEYPVTPVYTPPSLPDFPSRYVGEMAFFLPHPTQQSSNFILSAQKNVVWRWRSAWLVGLQGFTFFLPRPPPFRLFIAALSCAVKEENYIALSTSLIWNIRRKRGPTTRVLCCGRLRSVVPSRFTFQPCARKPL